MVKPAHCDTQRDYSCEKPRLKATPDGRFLKVSFSRSPGMEWNQEQFFKYGGTRGVCKGFSFGSRRRMLDRLNQVSKGADLPDFVTCTYPDQAFNDSVTEFAKQAKNDMASLVKRLSRVCPSACGFWRIEWKARKSGKHEGKLFPHFHLLVWGLLQRSLGVWGKTDKVTGEYYDEREHFESFVALPDSQLTLELVERLSVPVDCLPPSEVGEHKTINRSAAGVFCFKGRRPFVERCNSLVISLAMEKLDPAHHESLKARNMTFFDWVSLAWYHVVGTGNVDHLKAGCRVEKLRSWGGVASYCAKYMSKADSENFMSDVPTGRSWGIFNRGCIPWAKMIEFPLDDDAGIRLRRVMRRYLEHRVGRKINRHFGMTLYCDPSQFLRVLARPPDCPF
jgi:hypothetical protein